METIALFLGDRPAGYGFYQTIENRHLVVPAGRAYFCPICGDVWFRAHLPNRVIISQNRACIKHLPGSYYGGLSSGSLSRDSVPGSLWAVEDERFNLLIEESPILLSHELKAQLKAAPYRFEWKGELEEAAKFLYSQIRIPTLKDLS